MVYNFTALGQPNNLVGASLAIPLQAAALGVIIGFSLRGRRRRRNAGDRASQFDRMGHLMLQLIYDLDDMGCAAGALCEAASLPSESRSAEHTFLLDALSSSVGAVPGYKTLLQTPEGKFVYAAFIGAENEGRPHVCEAAFPDCPVEFDSLTRLLAPKARPRLGLTDQLAAGPAMGTPLIAQNFSNAEAQEQQ